MTARAEKEEDKDKKARLQALQAQNKPILKWDVPTPTKYDDAELRMLQQSEPTLGGTASDRYAGTDLGPQQSVYDAEHGAGSGPTFRVPGQDYSKYEAPPPSPNMGSFAEMQARASEQARGKSLQAPADQTVQMADYTPPAGGDQDGPPVHIAPQSAVINIGGGGQGGGFRRTISKPVQEEFEGAFGSTGAANAQEIELAKQAEQEAAAIQANARDQASKEMAQQIGTAEGQYFIQQNELKKAQDVQMAAQHEADEAVKQVKEAKIDPNKFYHEKDTLTNIGLALSVAMGAYWSTLTGGPNQAMQIVDKAIDRDIKAQEVNLANKRASSNTALQRNLAATGSMERAKELTRMQLLELTRMAATKMSMDNMGAVQQANHVKVMGALEGSINKSMAALQMAHANYRMNTEQFVQPQNLGFKLIDQADEMMKHWVPGIGLVPNADEAKDLRKDTAELAEFQRTLNKAASMLGEIGTLERKYKDASSLFRDPKFMEFQSLIQRARFSRSNAAKQGVIREQEAANFDQMVANPNNWSGSEDAQKAMGAIAQDVNGELSSQRLQHAGQDAEIVQVRDPRTGFIKRVPIPLEMAKPGQTGFNQALSPGIQLQPTTSK